LPCLALPCLALPCLALPCLALPLSLLPSHYMITNEIADSNGVGNQIDDRIA
jgi:hypothetical protein